jgi:hypothetical protein
VVAGILKNRRCKWCDRCSGRKPAWIKAFEAFYLAPVAIFYRYGPVQRQGITPYASARD